MKLFVWLALRLHHHSAVSATQLRTTIRYMRAYADAYPLGNFLPPIPKTLRRNRALMALIAAFRLSLHEPALFVFGTLFFLPALAYSLWWAVLRVMRLFA